MFCQELLLAPLESIEHGIGQVIVHHSPIHDQHTQVLAADALDAQLVGEAKAQAEWLGYLGDPYIHHGPGWKGCNLLPSLNALHEMM